MSQCTHHHTQHQFVAVYPSEALLVAVDTDRSGEPLRGAPGYELDRLDATEADRSEDRPVEALPVEDDKHHMEDPDHLEGYIHQVSTIHMRSLNTLRHSILADLDPNVAVKHFTTRTPFTTNSVNIPSKQSKVMATPTHVNPNRSTDSRW